jgi:hypothetical protein
LRIPIPDLTLSKDYITNEITLSTTNFAMFVYLFVCGDSDHTLKLSNNYFNVSPGWPVTVKILNNDEDHRLRNMRICYKSVRDTYAANLINP